MQSNSHKFKSNTNNFIVIPTFWKKCSIFILGITAKMQKITIEWRELLSNLDELPLKFEVLWSDLPFVLDTNEWMHF